MYVRTYLCLYVCIHVCMYVYNEDCVCTYSILSYSSMPILLYRMCVRAYVYMYIMNVIYPCVYIFHRIVSYGVVWIVLCYMDVCMHVEQWNPGDNPMILGASRLCTKMLMLMTWISIDFHWFSLILHDFQLKMISEHMF